MKMDDMNAMVEIVNGVIDTHGLTDVDLDLDDSGTAVIYPNGSANTEAVLKDLQSSLKGMDEVKVTPVDPDGGRFEHPGIMIQVVNAPAATEETDDDDDDDDDTDTGDTDADDATEDDNDDDDGDDDEVEDGLDDAVESILAAESLDDIRTIIESADISTEAARGKKVTGQEKKKRKKAAAIRKKKKLKPNQELKFDEKTGKFTVIKLSAAEVKEKAKKAKIQARKRKGRAK